MGTGSARDLPVLGRHERDAAGDGGDKLFAAGELAVGERLVGVGRGDFAVGDDEGRGVAAPLFGGDFDQGLTSGGGHGAQARTHLRRGLAAEGAHVVGSEVSVAHDHGDGVEGDHELVGDLLGKRGADILADLDLAGEDGDAVVGGDVDPGGDVVGHLLAATAEAAAAGLLSGRLAGEADQQAAAEELEEGAAVEREAARRVGGIGQSDFEFVGEDRVISGASSGDCLSPASMEARWTAATMRG